MDVQAARRRPNMDMDKSISGKKLKTNGQNNISSISFWKEGGWEAPNVFTIYYIYTFVFEVLWRPLVGGAEMGGWMEKTHLLSVVIKLLSKLSVVIM